MSAQIMPILLTLAAGWVMLWSGIVKKRVVLVCRRCGLPCERCRCERRGRR